MLYNAADTNSSSCIDAAGIVASVVIVFRLPQYYHAAAVIGPFGLFGVVMSSCIHCWTSEQKSSTNSTKPEDALLLWLIWVVFRLATEQDTKPPQPEASTLAFHVSWGLQPLSCLHTSAKA